MWLSDEATFNSFEPIPDLAHSSIPGSCKQEYIDKSRESTKATSSGLIHCLFHGRLGPDQVALVTQTQQIRLVSYFHKDDEECEEEDAEGGFANTNYSKQDKELTGDTIIINERLSKLRPRQTSVQHHSMQTLDNTSSLRGSSLESSPEPRTYDQPTRTCVATSSGELSLGNPQPSWSCQPGSGSGQQCMQNRHLQRRRLTAILVGRTFRTARANVAVFAGRWLWEARLLTPGVMQIGWCQADINFGQDVGWRKI
ncbi:unnamed protein product [Protopolystoma xenopodis]|uniref:Uncharacterized protein n=1 Tax=Protopolystoma xenopodis TaxID=117903 RepID=A0A448WJD2_9PLAT|nr:unnamed protein product [Protopolystoma xenopodis]